MVTNAAPADSKVEMEEGSSKATVTCASFVAVVVTPAVEDSCPAEVSDAIGVFMDEVDDFDETTPETLPGGEGWVLTATFEETSFYVRCRRNIAGSTFAISSDTSSEEGMTAAAEFCKSLR